MPPRLSLLSSFAALSLRATRPAVPCVAAQVRFLSSDTINPSNVEAGFSDVLRSRMEAFGQVKKEEENPQKEEDNGLSENQKAIRQLELAAYGLDTFNVDVHGHKFGVPPIPLAKNLNHKRRYDTVVEQITKMLMKDGKLAKAQRDLAMVLNHLRSSPAPKLNPNKPLVPGAPPAHELPLDPVTYLTVAVDSVAPLIYIQRIAKLAGGGRALELPAPLHQRQRRRAAIKWILDIVNKKPSKGSGRSMFPTRVAEEIIAVVEGRSSVWDKRHEIHKKGTSVRANVNSPKLKKMRHR